MMDDSICVICSETAKLFVVGSCDHPVCHRCSARLRKLCKSTQCPVCREDLLQVVVSREQRAFSSFGDIRSLHGNRELGMRFEDRSMHHDINQLFVAQCPVCKNRAPEVTFQALKRHMRDDHDLFYCEICEEHLNLFPKERKCYSRAELATHNRVGDDDGVRKGHPECKFCYTRYLDDDGLLTHLRQNHFWCHICERDGKQAYYYNYTEVRKHFAEAHILCTEGACAHEKFTSVFASELDYQAHRVKEHSVSRSEARQMRKLDASSLFAYPASSSASASAGAGSSVSSSSSRSAPARRNGNRKPEDGGRQTRSRREVEDIQLAEALSQSMQIGNDRNLSGQDQPQEKQKQNKTKGGSKSMAGKKASTPSCGVSQQVSNTASSASSVASSVPSDGASVSQLPEAPVTSVQVHATSASSLPQDDYPDLSAAVRGEQPASSANGYASKLSSSCATVKPVETRGKPKQAPPGLVRASDAAFPSLSATATMSQPPGLTRAADADFPALSSTSSARHPQRTAPPGFASAAASGSVFPGGIFPTSTLPSSAAQSTSSQWVSAKSTPTGSSAIPSGTSCSHMSAGNTCTPQVPPGLVPATKGTGKGSRKSSPEEVRGTSVAASAPHSQKAKKRSLASNGKAKAATEILRGRSEITSSSAQQGDCTGEEFQCKPCYSWKSLPDRSDPAPSLCQQSSGQEFENKAKLALLFNEEAFQTFRRASGQFYSGSIAGDEYYASLISLFDASLPELLESILQQLPDEKRLELLRAKHNERVARQNQPKQEASKRASKHQRPMPSAWGQPSSAPAVQAAAEVQPSKAQVNDQDFPSLGSTGSAIRSKETDRQQANKDAVCDDFPALSSKPLAPSMAGVWMGRRK